MQSENVNTQSQSFSQNFQVPLQSAEIDQISTALVKAQSQMTFAPKDSKIFMGNGFRKYADLASVLEAVRKPLSDNGLAVTQLPQRCQNGILLRTQLTHISGQWIAGELFVPVDFHTPPKGMNVVQSMGSAITYARRYSLAAICGIAQDDDDGTSSGRINQNDSSNGNSKSTPVYPAITKQQVIDLGKLIEVIYNKDINVFYSEASCRLNKSLHALRELNVKEADVLIQELKACLKMRQAQAQIENQAIPVIAEEVKEDA